MLLSEQAALRRSAQLFASARILKLNGFAEILIQDWKIRNMKNMMRLFLAAAGLSRMGWARDTVTEFIDPEICVPAVGQGALIHRMPRG